MSRRLFWWAWCRMLRTGLAAAVAVVGLGYANQPRHRPFTPTPKPLTTSHDLGRVGG